eukprot:CAMPEP_0171248734 /NCGR_PEP_ID=MMETSP0790-20130122/49173_1 /TAXON_ID=2925 /ORGANISM="Alexandrium catenella, Strain OF101" /LENGTH=113 /DNA_ID=CAMNT_0011716203 /DNA_START=300 /DNA_END=638 /DNA_ORIENTATION=+
MPTSLKLQDVATEKQGRLPAITCSSNCEVGYGLCGLLAGRQEELGVHRSPACLHSIGHSIQLRHRQGIVSIGYQEPVEVALKRLTVLWAAMHPRDVAVFQPIRAKGDPMGIAP